jgi:hypothetical protein
VHVLSLGLGARAVRAVVLCCAARGGEGGGGAGFRFPAGSTPARPQESHPEFQHGDTQSLFSCMMYVHTSHTYHAHHILSRSLRGLYGDALNTVRGDPPLLTNITAATLRVIRSVAQRHTRHARLLRSRARQERVRSIGVRSLRSARARQANRGSVLGRTRREGAEAAPR